MLNLVNVRNLNQRDKPTQVAGHILDCVVTKDPNFISNVCVLDRAISDHSVITFNINEHSDMPNKRVVHIKHVNYDKLGNETNFHSL